MSENFLRNPYFHPLQNKSPLRILLCIATSVVKFYINKKSITGTVIHQSPSHHNISRDRNIFKFLILTSRSVRGLKQLPIQGLFALANIGQEVKVATNIHLVSKLRLLMVATPFPPYILMAWFLYNPSYNSAFKEVSSKKFVFNCRHLKAETRAFYDVKVASAQNKNRTARDFTSFNGFRGRLNCDVSQNSELIQILT